MEEQRLGCKAHELEVGDEFSCDEGRTWLVVRTEVRYVDDGDLNNMTMKCNASPSDDARLGSWIEVQFEEHQHVLLQKDWV